MANTAEDLEFLELEGVSEEEREYIRQLFQNSSSYVTIFSSESSCSPAHKQDVSSSGTFAFETSATVAKDIVPSDRELSSSPLSFIYEGGGTEEVEESDVGVVPLGGNIPPQIPMEGPLPLDVMPSEDVIAAECSGDVSPVCSLSISHLENSQAVQVSVSQSTLYSSHMHPVSHQAPSPPHVFNVPPPTLPHHPHMYHAMQPHLVQPHSPAIFVANCQVNVGTQDPHTQPVVPHPPMGHGMSPQMQANMYQAPYYVDMSQLMHVPKSSHDSMPEYDPQKSYESSRYQRGYGHRGKGSRDRGSRGRWQREEHERSNSVSSDHSGYSDASSTSKASQGHGMYHNSLHSMHHGHNVGPRYMPFYPYPLSCSQLSAPPHYSSLVYQPSLVSQYSAVPYHTPLTTASHVHQHPLDPVNSCPPMYSYHNENSVDPHVSQMPPTNGMYMIPSVPPMAQEESAPLLEEPPQQTAPPPQSSPVPASSHDQLINQTSQLQVSDVDFSATYTSSSIHVKHQAIPSTQSQEKATSHSHAITVSALCEDGRTEKEPDHSTVVTKPFSVSDSMVAATTSISSADICSGESSSSSISIQKDVVSLESSQNTEQKECTISALEKNNFSASTNGHAVAADHQSSESVPKTATESSGDRSAGSSLVGVDESPPSSTGNTHADEAHRTPTDGFTGREYFPSALLKNKEATPTAWSGSKSWAQVLKSGDEIGHKQVALVTPFHSEETKTTEEQESSLHSKEDTPVSESDEDKIKIGLMLQKYVQNNNHVYLQPRGLINRGYWCYVNAPLQALLACTPFYNLISAIPHAVGVKPMKSGTPVLDTVVEYVQEFSEMVPLVRVNRKDKAAGIPTQDIVTGHAFEPQYIYKILTNINGGDQFQEGHQQDAEEMLSYLLNALHDEMVESLKLAAADDKSSSSVNGSLNDNPEETLETDDDEWRVMGPGRKSCVTRKTHFSPSPVSDIFWGQLRSVLCQTGERGNANLQPFTTLPLDIQSPKVDSVKDALEHLVSREEISGYTCPKLNQIVPVFKQVMLEHLPPILILHLKRFIYNKDGGLQKVTKKVDFPIDLEITKELLSANSRSKFGPNQRRYKLLAVIYHDGQEATKGHYVADIYHSGYCSWLRYDDSTVLPMMESSVLKHLPPRVPYLLFYRRLDTVIGSKMK